MKKELLRYRYVILLAIINLAYLVFNPPIGMEITVSTINNFKSMLGILPPVFILLGLLDVWVPRETMIKYLGVGSGARGVSLAIFLGAAAAGPLYVAFPIAQVMIRKGAKFSNVITFLGAWSTLKIPVVLFEVSALGWQFAVTRWLINIPGIIIMGFVIDKLVGEREKQQVLELNMVRGET